MKLFKKKTKTKPRYIKYLSNVIQRDSMGYPLRLCMLSDNTHKWIDTYDEYVGENDVELIWHECNIPFGDVVFPIRQGVMKMKYEDKAICKDIPCQYCNLTKRELKMVQSELNDAYAMLQNRDNKIKELERELKSYETK